MSISIFAFQQYKSYETPIHNKLRRTQIDFHSIPQRKWNGILPPTPYTARPIPFNEMSRRERTLAFYKYFTTPPEFSNFTRTVFQVSGRTIESYITNALLATRESQRNHKERH